MYNMQYSLYILVIHILIFGVAFSLNFQAPQIFFSFFFDDEGRYFRVIACKASYVHLKITMFEKGNHLNQPLLFGFHVNFFWYVKWVDDSKSTYVGSFEMLVWPSIRLKLVVWSSRYKSKIWMNIPSQFLESDLVWKHLVVTFFNGRFWWPSMCEIKKRGPQMILEGPLPLRTIPTGHGSYDRSTQLMENANVTKCRPKTQRCHPVDGSEIR